MKAIKGIEGLVPLIVEYKHVSNDDAISKFLDDLVECSECENGLGSEEAL